MKILECGTRYFLFYCNTIVASFSRTMQIANLITDGSPYEPLLELNFEIKSFIQSINFYYKYHTSKWAQELSNRYEKELLVDVLYVHCLLNYNKPIEENWSTTFKDIIDGLYFYPSSLFCHADGICLNFSDDGPYGVIVSNKLHNCDTISEFFTDVQKGIKCTMSKKEDFNAILSSKNRLIPLVAHLHVKYQHIKTTKGERFIKGYSNGGKYLIMDPDPNSIRELCPDTFHLLQRNLFNTTKIK